MSDADRLREAADRLDEWAANAERSSLPRVAARTRAQAALLRAVADEGDHDERISGFQLWPNTYDAALALANAILGVSDD